MGLLLCVEILAGIVDSVMEDGPSVKATGVLWNLEDTYALSMCERTFQ